MASYHRDHGEGLDFYKVGRTLGPGMKQTAPFTPPPFNRTDTGISGFPTGITWA
ncbi:DUF4861 family protein [Petrimonas sp.]|uniref:DUF4861 family protein n=1 Tax=Petrimonas sp. TaxID=2023866 RepID=UPI003F519322